MNEGVRTSVQQKTRLDSSRTAELSTLNPGLGGLLPADQKRYQKTNPNLISNIQLWRIGGGDGREVSKMDAEFP